MASTLRIDFDELAATIKSYENLITQLANVKNDANNAIKVLESTKWRSAASEAFFNNYSTNWTRAFDDQIKSLDFLRDQLVKAQGQYSELYEEIERIASAVRNAS